MDKIILRILAGLGSGKEIEIKKIGEDVNERLTLHELNLMLDCLTVEHVGKTQAILRLDSDYLITIKIKEE